MDQHHGRSRAATTIAAGPARFALTSADCPVFSSQDLRGSRKTLQEQVSHRTSQTSRKPHSADTGKTSGVCGVDPAAVFGGPARSSCPPLDLRAKAVDGVTEGQAPYRGSPHRPKLRPFPDIPPLSPPHLPMGSRGARMGTLDNEVVEISD